MEQQVDLVVTSVRGFLTELAHFLPNLLAAIVILVVGWLLSKLLMFIVVRGLKAVKFNTVTEVAGLDSFLKKGGIRKSAIDVLGLLAYWLVMLGTLLIAFNSLGLTQASELFKSVTLFIPNVIVAVLILTIGLYIARLVADSIGAYSRNVGLQDADLVGRVAYYAIATFVVFTALSQMHIGEDIFKDLLKIIFGTIGLALALAFGLGGQKWAAEQLDKFTKTKK